MQVNKYRILVIDTDESEFEKLETFLGESFHCELVRKPETALINLRKKFYDAVLCELEFGEITGISLLKNLRKSFPSYIFVIFSKRDFKAEYAVEAIQNNVSGFMMKPLVGEESVTAFKRLLQRQTIPLKRLRDDKNYKMENNFHIVIPATEEDIINAMDMADQMTNLLYPASYGNFSDLKISLYEALNNAKLYGSNSGKNLINLRIEFKFDRITCHVKDQGKGFQHKGVKDKPNYLKACSGLTLIKSLMDEYSFNSSGNEINFMKIIKHQLNPEPKSS